MKSLVTINLAVSLAQEKKVRKEKKIKVRSSMSKMFNVIKTVIKIESAANLMTFKIPYVYCYT